MTHCTWHMWCTARTWHMWWHDTCGDMTHVVLHAHDTCVVQQGPHVSCRALHISYIHCTWHMWCTAPCVMTHCTHIHIISYIHKICVQHHMSWHIAHDTWCRLAYVYMKKKKIMTHGVQQRLAYAIPKICLHSAYLVYVRYYMYICRARYVYRYVCICIYAMYICKICLHICKIYVEHGMYICKICLHSA